MARDKQESGRAAKESGKRYEREAVRLMQLMTGVEFERTERGVKQEHGDIVPARKDSPLMKHFFEVKYRAAGFTLALLRQWDRSTQDRRKLWREEAADVILLARAPGVPWVMVTDQPMMKSHLVLTVLRQHLYGGQ